MKAVTEIAVSSFTDEDMVLGMHRLPDGYQLCLGCEDTFVLAGYCACCQRINAEIESRRGTMAPDPSARVDVGVVPFDPSDTEGPASPWAVATIFAGAVVSMAIVMAGLWVPVRWVIAVCLKHS